MYQRALVVECPHKENCS
ncbi:hypothetical protein LINGRAPRIM_LOCUS1387 [Linum grandiflorum]